MARPGEMQRAATKFIVFENFEKMNTKPARQGLPEKQLAWLENLQPIAENLLAVVPNIGAALASIAQTINSLYYAVIGGTDYLFAFTSAGSSWIINVGTGATSKWAPDGTFSNPDLTVWQASRVLINDPTAGYCTFDGSIFAHQGGVSPVIPVTSGGFGYTSAPNVQIQGGSGTGALAHSVISGGQVIAIVLDNPGTGYAVNDVLVVSIAPGAGNGGAASVTMSGSGVASVTITNGGFYLAPPTVSFSGGGGSGAAGTAITSGTSVVGVNITNPGSGYTSPPTVTFSAGGTTATGLSVLIGQSVTSITLTSAGGGYPSPPAVVFSGGGGSGAAAHTTVAAGAITSITLDAGGNGYQSAPSVTISPGQGAAAAAHVWPFVPGGTTLAVFQGRVWLGGNRLLQYTGTQGYDDFNAGNAAGSLTISDADLVHSITALRAYNNFLWIMGDQSVKQIGNISLNAAGNVTLFTILTLSSDQGTIWPRSCVSYNRVFLFANVNGIYAVFGSSVQKVSDDMDGIWKLVDFSRTPQASIADINAIHNVMYLVRYQDPAAGTRSILLIFDGKKWFVGSQGSNLRALATAAIAATGTTEPFGSSGTDLTPLLADPTTAVTFKLQTALTHHGNAVQRKRTQRMQWAYTASGTGTLTVTLESDEATQQLVPSIAAGFNTRMVSDPNVTGKYLGMTVQGNLAGFSLQNLAIEFQDSNVGNKN